MITPETLDIARQTAEDLRRRGEIERSKAIEALVEATDRESVASTDLVTPKEAGELVGVSGQTIKNWIRNGRFKGFRIGGRFVIPREAVADYVRRAGFSLDLDEISDAEAADLVAESRSKPNT